MGSLYLLNNLFCNIGKPINWSTKKQNFKRSEY